MASYEKINWKTTTPINTTNLDHMDQGILDAMNNIPEGATKFAVEEEQTDFNVGLLEDINDKTLYAKSKTDYVTDADGNTVTAKFATVDSSIETLNTFKTDTETALEDVVHYEETEETSSSVVVQADIATKDSTGTNIASQFASIKTDISNLEGKISYSNQSANFTSSTSLTNIHSFTVPNVKFAVVEVRLVFMNNQPNQLVLCGENMERFGNVTKNDTAVCQYLSLASLINGGETVQVFAKYDGVSENRVIINMILFN